MRTPKRHVLLIAGALLVGSRVGKYAEDGTPRSIPGHSLPLAALGVFILGLGWFGFNAGSTTVGTPAIAKIALNTFGAAGGGAATAMVVTWIDSGTPDATMTLNGVLGGLVGITAGCAALTPPFAILTGAMAGVIVVYATRLLERMVDDPVGAIAVHGVCGVWGTIAVGLFNASGFSLSQLGVQVVGVMAAYLWTFPVSFGLFYLLDCLVGLRIEDETEHKGLDLQEHQAETYPEFGTTDVEGGATGRLSLPFRLECEGIRPGASVSRNHEPRTRRVVSLVEPALFVSRNQLPASRPHGRPTGPRRGRGGDEASGM